MLSFATLFDINYLSRGLALLGSLTEHSSRPFRFFVLALDDDVITYFNRHQNDHVKVISIGDVEKHFPELATAKANRSVVEYYFTLSPYLPLYILQKFKEVDQITTMDADLYFFDDPAIIFNQYPNASVLITPHHFSTDLKNLLAFGKYNVSFQSFKNDEPGLSCLYGWCRACLEWCYDYYDEKNGRFADQKYLDSWVKTFPAVQDIDIPGAGLAPWNIENYSYQITNRQVLVNHQPLVYFHFHQLRIFNKNFAFNGLELFKARPNRKAVKLIYHKYLKKLNSLADVLPNTDHNILRNSAFLKHNIIRKLHDPTGYWFFNNTVIHHLNLVKTKANFKKAIKSLWPG